MIRAKWFALLLVGVVCCIGYSAGLVPIAMSSSQHSSDRKLRRTIDQSRIDEIKRHDLNLNNLRTSYADGTRPTIPFDRSILREVPVASNAFSASAGALPPPASPGLPIAQTSYDYQSNSSQGHRVARIGGADIVHFTWMSWDHIPASIDDNDRHVSYNSYDITGNFLIQGFEGMTIDEGEFARGGYPAGDVWDDNSFQAVFHQHGESLPYGTQHTSFPTPGSSQHVTDALGGITGGCTEVMWPRLATSRDGSRTSHVIAHTNSIDCPTELLWYWRFNGTDWTGPVIIDSTPHISYVIADDPTGEKLAIAVHVSNWASMNGLNNVAYLESTTDGAGWIAGTEPTTKQPITNYNNEAGPGAWLHLDACYDHDGVLHVAFDEQAVANETVQATIRHWNSQRQTIRPVAMATWPTGYLTGVYNLNLSNLSMGIGDGSTLCQSGVESNENYVYIIYTQFGGTTQAEEDDVSLEGRYNGELYLTVSPTGGNTWSPAANLTNTKTPRCNPGPADTLTGIPPRPDSVCRSENWATIGMVVSDIDIHFISDRDAGGIPQGEGTWQLNPVHYLRIPGGTTNAQHVCPLIQANFEASLSSNAECEWNTGQSGLVTEDLTLMNLGNGDLSGTIGITDFPGAATLSVSGSAGYTIIAGDPDDIRTVTMSANGAPEGLYQGTISITHNDPSEASPREYPISLFVFNSFFCPQGAPALRTGAGGPNGLGSLFLEVQSNGSFASQNPEGGLWRYADSSSAIFDASLLVAHGSQGVDTTVFLNFYSRASNGQYGFRAVGEMVVDAAAQGTGTGCSYASARMCTNDSVVGITVEWYYPQDYSMDELIIARYQFYRHDPVKPVTALAIGILADLDVLPASRLGSIQVNSTNSPGFDSGRNLVWVSGADSMGHFPVGQNTATRFRGGIIAPEGFAGAIVGDAEVDIKPGNGPTDALMYNQLQNLSGIDLYSGSSTDLYLTVALDRNRSIAEGETLTYFVVLVSDTASEASLKVTADEALSAWHSCVECYSGPCWADPQCDGIRSNVQDVVQTVNVAFRGVAETIDPGASVARTDVDADGTTTILDVVRVVNVAFRGQSVAANYVDPCSSW